MMDATKDAVIVWLLSTDEEQIPISKDKLQRFAKDVCVFNRYEDCVERLSSI